MYLIIAGVLLLFVIAVISTPAAGLSKLSLTDSQRKKITLTDTRMVFVFLSPDCPLSQHYSMELNTLAKNNIARFFGVIPGAFYDAKSVNEFRERHHIDYPLLLDTDLKLTKMLGATITPQAVVVERNDILYSGAIDNAYINIGERHKGVISRYLKDALSAIQNNTLPRIRKTNAIGCMIKMGSPNT